jgi:predicted metal-dependent hydrolase
MDFRMEATPRYFYDDNATATLFFAMLSSWFPPGERFFMTSVRNFREIVSDEKLKDQVSGFMGQEAIHGREHDKLNQLLEQRGMDLTVPVAVVKAGLRALEYLPKSTQIAATTFMEHFTALLAEELLENPQFAAKADPEMIKLWQWHAFEELEHKAVAYDVYDLVGNSRAERAVAAAAVVITLVPAAFFSWAWLVTREGKATDVKDIRKGMELLFGRQGFVTKVLPKLPLFLSRRFHPAQHDTRALEEKWARIMFGDQGFLNGYFRNRDAVIASPIH